MKPSVRASAIFWTALLLAQSGLSKPAWSAASPLPSGGSSEAKPAAGDSAAAAPTVAIPGPLRSFLRMAGVSQKAAPEEILPLVAHQIQLDGYGGTGRGGTPTEYLILVKRYVEQARELRALAGPEGVIRVANCAGAQPLLSALGYRLRLPCGPDTSLITGDPKRAFLTVDAGFPLAQLERTVRGGVPFAYPYANSPVPVLFRASDWAAIDPNKKDKDLIDSIMSDPLLSRLYWALAQLDEETRNFLQKSVGLEKLLPLAPALDFYGDQIRVESGRVVVPGGAPAEAAWKHLVGASPDSPKEFILGLLSKDEGWLAAYFDALSRIRRSQQAYFTTPPHLERFYAALRGQRLTPNPVKAVFRTDPGLMLLVSQLYVDPNGEAHVPGDMEVWRHLLNAGKVSKNSKERNKWARQLNHPEDLVGTLFALSRQGASSGALEIYLALSEMDRERAPNQRLSPQTALLLGENFSRLGGFCVMFSEFNTLNDTSINNFVNLANALDHIPDSTVRTEAIGVFQAETDLWQILARQGQIPREDWNDSWQRVLQPFADVHSTAQLFDATLRALGELWQAAAGKTELSQDQFIDLVAGPNPTSPERSQIREQLADRIRTILDQQRLVSFDTLVSLGNGLRQSAQGKTEAATLVPMAEELREFEMPKPIFTTGERVEYTAGYFQDSHVQAEMETNLVQVLKSPKGSSEWAGARGRVVPFLRDFLVGLVYAYYAPPGSQMLNNNPLFIRRHDFSGELERGSEPAWGVPRIMGRGDTSGGGAHLTGGLASLPTALAQVEQEFYVPDNIQSLIWEDLVPSLMTGAIVPRWWRVTPRELHAAALYQRCGEELLTAAAGNATLRQTVVEILSDRVSSRRLGQIDKALRAGRAEEALSPIAPSELFSLASQFRQRFPEQLPQWGEAGRELHDLAQHYPEEVSAEKLSEDFGVPHPLLAHTYARQFQDLKPLPTFMGYSSLLLAETWESNNLYWARLADERGLPPEMLNRLAPELTRRMVEKIFATHLDDWPALLRALRETGEEFRSGKKESLPKISAVSQP